jgi:hypothetical protein
MKLTMLCFSHNIKDYVEYHKFVKRIVKNSLDEIQKMLKFDEHIFDVRDENEFKMIV